MSIISKISDLRKYVIPEFIFGEDSLSLTGHYANIFGINKAFVISDSGLMKTSLTEKIINSLENYGIDTILYTAVSPNPRDSEVSAGCTAYIANKCDGIIAVGGGSVMDAAKGVGIEAVNQKNILEFEGVNKVALHSPPLICIPTTGGTGSEVSQFSIINNTRERRKIAIISKAVVPDLAIIDPDTLLTMDAYLTACTGMDALVHSIEAYLSTASSHITDNFALDAIKLIGENLKSSVLDLGNRDLRAKIMMASLEAGIAFSNAGLGVVHSMAHSLGGYLDLAHGECNSMLLNSAVDFNYSEDTKQRFNQIAKSLGVSKNSAKELFSKEDIMKYTRYLSSNNAA